MLTTIVFIIILGLLIFVHELGHFVTARRNGIKAEEFGFGFPPRAFGFLKDEKTGKWKFIPGNREVTSKNTLYSMNWIPLGGFVRIKGEGGDNKGDADSFAAKGAWPRIKVLAAGVIMNFIFAWFLIAIALMIGVPHEFANIIDPNSEIVVSQVSPDSPAERAGLKVGDQIISDQGAVQVKNENDFLAYINAKKGQEIVLNIERNGQSLDFKLTPRVDVPEGQGPIGIAFGGGIKNYVWYDAIWKGFLGVIYLIGLTLFTLFIVVKNLLLGQAAGIEVAGPVGIFKLTGQAVQFGLVPTILFTSILSINLGIINALPIPALDGGRILFILIEKIKGRPVQQKTEQLLHTIGFILLIMLMVFITVREVFMK
ncbi:MAG: RIP metalloprotease RseP [Parcubacteria group bacterium]|jgi:regulator of sigma E protease